LTTAEINRSFSPDIDEDENEEVETQMAHRDYREDMQGTTREYRVEDIKQEIERLERRQSTGGRISTNGSLTLGK
jgi:anti-sigma28 factor (negative regulator of flagellin synthesis)